MQAISVIVPVYKVEKYIRRCVDSILSQTFKDFDLILVDDGSPDNCGAICDEYALKDKRIHVIHQNNGGLSVARNAGLDLVIQNDASEWITFIDSDDWVHACYLEALYAAVQSTDSFISCCEFQQTNGDDPKVNMKQLNANLWSVEEYFCERNINATIACGKLFHKTCFQSIRFPRGKIHEDEYTIYKVLFAYSKLAVVEQSLYAYFVNESSIIHTKWSPRRLQEFEALRRQKEFFVKKGFKKASRFVTKHKIISLTVNLKKIKEDGVKTKYSIILRLILKLNLLLHSKDVRFTEEHYWIYETAFPFVMNIFWIIKGAINKFFK